MGTADLVPGVSGGTIALVVGIYERLVRSVREAGAALGALVKVEFATVRDQLHQVEWRLVIPLVLGIVTAVVALAGLIERQLEERPTVMAGLFLGLVVVSVFVAWMRIRSHGARHWLIALAVGSFLFAVLGMGDSRLIQDPALVVFAAAGALAVCAMILPGISGSLILVMVGLYAPVIGAVADRDVAVIAVFALGAIVGLSLFSQALHWALEHHHDDVMAGLVGLMAGSVRMLWPWPDGVNGPGLAPPGSDLPAVVAAAMVGAAAVWLIARLAPDHA